MDAWRSNSDQLIEMGHSYPRDSHVVDYSSDPSGVITGFHKQYVIELQWAQKNSEHLSNMNSRFELTLFHFPSSLLCGR
jgi:hypothetical protein